MSFTSSFVTKMPRQESEIKSGVLSEFTQE